MVDTASNGDDGDDDDNDDDDDDDDDRRGREIHVLLNGLFFFCRKAETGGNAGLVTCHTSRVICPMTMSHDHFSRFLCFLWDSTDGLGNRGGYSDSSIDKSADRGIESGNVNREKKISKICEYASIDIFCNE